MVMPIDNMDEAKLVHGIEIIGLENLSEVIRLIEGKLLDPGRIHTDISNVDKENDIVFDFADVKGQNGMIAQRIPTILPKMTEEECLEVTKIYNISGILNNGHNLIKNRPFRAPHHNASFNALIGGGINAMPGEVSLAHY